MKKRKILLVLAIIIFPWTLVPLVLYYFWRRGFLVRIQHWILSYSRKLKGMHLGREGGLVEETAVFRYYRTCNDSLYLIMPRTLGVQCIYAIRIADMPERLTRNIEEIIRAAMENLGGNERTLISLVIKDRIERIQIHYISRVLPGLGSEVEREAFERTLRINDALRAKSPTLKVSLCRAKEIVESMWLEG